jgi:hypothetical protein
MSNRFYNFITRFIAGTKARSSQVNSELDNIVTGFGLLQTEVDVISSITAGMTLPPFTLASATATLISISTSNNVTLTGTATITSFDTMTAGIIRYVTATGACTLTHNATSLILPGAANIVAAANDSFILKSLGSGNWQVIGYQKASGYAVKETADAAETALTTANTPAGNIAATNVQAAINELDTEKAKLAGDAAQDFSTLALTAAGDITISGEKALRGSQGKGGISTNLIIGTGAFASNTTGYSSTGVGSDVLNKNTTGGKNSAFGDGALKENTTGDGNTAVGFHALTLSTTNSASTALGSEALSRNTTGYGNTAVGANALILNTTGYDNTGIGVAALFNTTTGSGNSVLGSYALYVNTAGESNAVVGSDAMHASTTGSKNTAIGRRAMYGNTAGNYNTAIGYEALYSNTTGCGNTAISPHNSAGSYLPVFDPTTNSNRFCAGSTSVTNAYIQVAWTVVSDERDKTNFTPIKHGLEFIEKLKPIAYQFRMSRESNETNGGIRYGFKAQEILALEGEAPVIIDNEDSEKLRYNESSLIPVLVQALQELNAKFNAYVLSHP